MTAGERRPRRPSWPALLVLAGTATIVGAVIYGTISIGSIGTGALSPVKLGQQITFSPAGSYRANIFTTRLSGTDTAPRCTVMTTLGRRVALGDAVPYAVNTRYGMESSYGFQLRARETYLISCGSKAQRGAFAVVEVSQLPQTLSITLGVAGAVLASAGVIAMLVKRRRGRRIGH